MTTNLERLHWGNGRPALRYVAVDWYDGPLQGVVAFGNPAEEFRFRSVGDRYNPDGLDHHLAMTWPVPLGTIDIVVRGAEDESRPFAVLGPGEGEAWDFLGSEPLGATTFIAYFDFLRRVEAAWKAPHPVCLTKDEVDAILLTLPLDLDSGGRLP